MGKTIDDILDNFVDDPMSYSDPDRRKEQAKLYWNNAKAKSELLKALEQVAPQHNPLSATPDYLHGYNQAIDDYLANIRGLFK